MEKVQFDNSELKIIKEIPNIFGVMNPIYDTPISQRDNFIQTMEKDPLWLCTRLETSVFSPSVVPDNIARALVIEANGMEPRDDIDMFGIPWEYVPEAGGSMVRPGNHILDNANDWEKVLNFPDIDSWDWESSAKENNNSFLNADTFTQVAQLNGWWFERLVSFMGFEGAAMALIDDDQKNAVKALFEKTTDLGCRIIDKFVDYYENIEAFMVHDDWGSQRSPFFSDDAAREMIVPYMKKLTDHIHSKGLYANLHSCGHVESRVQCFIDSGWDLWSPQPMNDTIKLCKNFGDKICIGITPELFDSDTTSEDEQREHARELVRRVCKPEKSCFVNIRGGMMTAAFREELYKQSRIVYCG